MKNRIIKRIQDQAREQFKSWPVIKIDTYDPPNLPLMNRQCMHNALNEYRSRRSVAILEVVNIKKNPCAHYLSMDNQGKVYDPTLGWGWAGTEYRLSRYVHPKDDETDDMGEVLSAFKLRLFKMSDSKTLFIAKALMIKPRDCF